MSFSEQEIEEFKSEALDLLETAEKSLLGLDQGGDFKSLYDNVFRSLHNLKGASGMMELLKLQSHTHELENIFMSFKDKGSIPKNYISFFLQGVDVARFILNGETVDFSYVVEAEVAAGPQGAAADESVANHETPGDSLPPIPLADDLNKTEVETIASPIPTDSEKTFQTKSDNFDSVDASAMESNLTEKIESQTESSVNSQIETSSASKLTKNIHELEIHPKINKSQPGWGDYVAEAQEIIERLSKGLYEFEKGMSSDETSKETSRSSVDGLYRDTHSLKGAAFLFGHNAIGEVAHAMETCLDPLRNGTHKANTDFITLMFKSVEVLEKELEMTLSEAGLGVPPETIQNTIQSLFTSLGELEPMTIGKNELPTKSEEVEIPKAAVTNESSKTQVPPAKSEALASDKEGDSSGSIRVPVALLDKLMTLMGEMVLVRNQVLQFSNDSEDLDFVNLSQRLNVVTGEIQEEMMKTRMQPIGNVINKFQRVVRDISQDLKKKIQLVIEGAETELDKSLLEAIKDPLTHIVRNSCDHGIETPETRAKSGKTDTGLIVIKAYHEGGQVVIEVSDDGKGLNRTVLIQKSIEKGLLTEAQAAQMSEKEVFDLIFAPGFSTAAQVTNVSGRGVGMDVVRTNIERIGGTVDLSSNLGRGTTIRLKIPLTLAIVPALIVHCGDGTFAIPQVKLLELVRVDQASGEKLEYLQDTPVFRLRGNILPLVDLKKVLNQSNTQNSESENIINIAVLAAEDACFGLIVDEIEDTADIVVKPLNRLLKSLHVYSGATILGDGSVALILDVQGISRVSQLKNESETKERTVQGLSGKDETESLSETQEFLIAKLNSPTKHAILLNAVHRLEEFKVSSLEMSAKQKVVRYRNTVLPIIDVNQELGYSATDLSNRDTIAVVVVERGGRLYGMQVDSIEDTLSTAEVVDTSITTAPGLIGNLNLQNELIVVIDPYKIISLAFPDLDSKSVLKITERSQQTSETPKAQGSSPSISKSTVINSGDAKILLVEDTLFFRRIIANVLEGAGHTVTVANNGQEAVELLEKSNSPFDLIVSDIEMPRMNGFDFAKSVRDSSVHKETPLVALSSRNDTQYQKRGVEAGFDVYLEKMKPEVLLEVVSNLVVIARKSA